MARPASLEPRYDSAKDRWVVSLPAALSPTRRRKREHFTRKADALARAEQLRSLEKTSARAVRQAGPDLIRTAVDFDGLFRDVYGFAGGLAEACAEFAKRLDREQSSATVAELFDDFEKDHSRDWSGTSRTRWNWFRTQSSELLPMRAESVDANFLSIWLSGKAGREGWSDQTFNDVAGLLSGVWRKAVARKAVPSNPLEGVKRRRIPRRHVPVYSPVQVEALLNATWEHDRDLVPFFAIAIFAGLRPGDKDSEIANLRWEDVNLEEKWIRVGANFDNKTGTKRFVPIEGNLLAWLEPWRGSAGPVLPVNFVRRRRQMVRGRYQSPPGTPESEWKELVPYGEHVRDITRHTYGSYLDAKYRDRNLVMANMGHTNFTTYEQHYKNARSPQEAERFWSIVPPIR